MSIHNHTIPVTSIALYYLRPIEQTFGLPDGQYVTYWTAVDPLTDAPLGPMHPDPDPAYVRAYMRDLHPAAIECRVVEVWPR